MRRGKMIFTLTAVGMLLLTGCRGKEADFDVKSLGSDLRDKIEYQDDLTLLDAETAAMFINLSDVKLVDSAIYESSCATAEEIVVLKCENSESADNAVKALEERIEEQKESFTDYVPEEIPKLEDAVLVNSGVYVVLSVSGDSKTAGSIINEYMK